MKRTLIFPILIISSLTSYALGVIVTSANNHRLPSEVILTPEELICAQEGDLLVINRMSDDTIDIGFFNVLSFDTTQPKNHYVLNADSITKIISKN